MTYVSFKISNGYIIGFDISGHSTAYADDIEGKLVCAAVSSAAYMAANTLTEILKAEADIHIDDARMKFMLKSDPHICQVCLEGFKLHLSQLANQYKNNLKVITEVL
ncbi:MAG TPA: ribosomal-processing cysteine protease Prp [Clostridiales bacterium]|nr:ribosomal-processing cysteine protease Prp [Clostridiales bacterium]